MKSTRILSLSIAALGLIVGLGTLKVSVQPSIAVTPIKIAMAGGLAPQLQGKPVVVDIYADWCPGCKNIKPTLTSLKAKYKGKANFVVLNVTDKKTSKEAAATAAKLGLTNFYNANKAATSLVAIVDPASGKVLKQFRNNANIADYETVLNGAIAKMSAMKK